MDGIINVLKPPGMSSHDVVAWVRRLTGTKRAGHTGTLDPGAAGVLPVCLGRATKVAGYLLEVDKTYRAEMVLGVITDSADGFGEVLEERRADAVSREEVERLFRRFEGEIAQVPPMLSAVRHRGRRLYELARRGQRVDRGARNVRIKRLQLLSFAIPPGGRPRVLFEVNCSKGTYVRALCSDMGLALGCGAYMSWLVRLQVGPFLLADSFTLQELRQRRDAGQFASAVLPLDFPLQHLEAVTVPPDELDRVLHGHDFRCAGARGRVADGRAVRMYSPDGRFLGLGQARLGDRVQPVRMFCGEGRERCGS